MEIEKAVRKPALGMEKIKKLRVAGRSREGNRENEPVRLKLLIGVAAPGDRVLALHLWVREGLAVLKDKFLGRM